MLRFIRQVVNEQHDFDAPAQMNALNSTADMDRLDIITSILIDNNNTKYVQNKNIDTNNSLFLVFIVVVQRMDHR
jgi:hypothetical protein